MLEHDLHQLEVWGLLVFRRWLRIKRFPSPLRIHHCVQRHGSIHAGEIDIGPAIDQELRNIEMAVDCCEQQGCTLVATQGVQVRSIIDQALDGFEVPLPGCIHERRQSTLGISATPADCIISVVLCCRRSRCGRGSLIVIAPCGWSLPSRCRGGLPAVSTLAVLRICGLASTLTTAALTAACSRGLCGAWSAGCSPSRLSIISCLATLALSTVERLRRVLHLAGQIDVGAVFQKHLYRFVTIEGCCKGHCRLSAFGLFRLHVLALLYQQFDSGGTARACSHHQSGQSIHGSELRIRAGL